MSREVEAMLGNYLRNVWQENSSGLLLPNRNGRPRKRQYVVKFGLKPLLRKLGLPAKDVGLGAFRHGLGTALSNSKISPKTVQQILRHTDIKTTFRCYVHSDTDAQRIALSQITIGTTGSIAKCWSRDDLERSR
jgi:integrase